MTIDEFIEDFKKIAKQYNFTLQKDGGIYGIKDYRCYCPIIAVYHSKIGHYYPVTQASQIGAQLGLEYKDRQEIIKASDIDNSTPLRKQLIDCI